MTPLYLFLYLAAGVCFGLAAGRPARHANLLALGLLFWILVEVIQTFQQL